jgi:hypothetical protein
MQKISSNRIVTNTTLSEIPNNLPIQVTSFVGREKVIADLSSLLRGDTGFAITQSGMQTTLRPTFPGRLITLTGAGGSGKTRLACQVAMEALENFADGVWFIELASLRDPISVPEYELPRRWVSSANRDARFWRRCWIGLLPNESC